MARLFDDASSEYLLAAGTLGLSAWPITFACWFNSDAALNQTLIAFGDTDAGIDVELRLRDPADSDVIMVVENVGLEFAATSSSWSTNTWHHACGIVASNTSRSVYLDGANKGSDVGNKTWPAGLDNTSIGALKNTSIIQQETSGLIAECVIWNAALTDAEVAEHAAGVTAWQVRPQNIVFYADLIRDLNDKAGGLVLTANGTVVSPHPRIIEEGSTRGVWAAAGAPAAAPGAILLMDHFNGGFLNG